MRTIVILIFLFILHSSSSYAQSDSITISSPKDSSGITERIEVVNKSFDNLVTKLSKEDDKNSIWDTLIPLLIGAGLAFLAQFSVELWKIRSEKIKKKRELRSNKSAKIYLITQVIRDLAAGKVHKQYYLKAYELSKDEEDLRKHYEKGQEQREIETKLDKNIADYIQLAAEYSILTNSKDRFDENFKKVCYYEHPKSSKFEDCTNEKDLVKKHSEAEKLLLTEYEKLISMLYKT